MSKHHILESTDTIYYTNEDPAIMLVWYILQHNREVLEFEWIHYY